MTDALFCAVSSKGANRVDDLTLMLRDEFDGYL